MSAAAPSRQWYLHDADATRAAGQLLGRSLLQLPTTLPLLITLEGELGAGKTTLVGGLLAALGQGGAVRSPTYTLIEPYELSGRQCYHLDLYRLTDPLQLEELGVRDLMHPGAVLLVEWPERADGLLGKPDLAIQLSYDTEEGRHLLLVPGTKPLQQLVDGLTI